MSLIILIFYLATKNEGLLFFPSAEASHATHALFTLTLNPNSPLSLQGSEIIHLTVIQCILWTAAS